MGSFMDDMLRRDLQLMTLAISLKAKTFGNLIDTFDGINDLEKGYTTPTEPDKTFIDDPLRMLRAVRFACQLDFQIDKKTIKSIIKLIELIFFLLKELQMK